ncbi:hypothetical protein AB835_11590 [Candidatus Endobugula sertula]|uniref:Gp5/Type VI secretion system Vgr protein OB-fold domain-containing protein n=1 Tax=Candidatus Endobugula sertula TaxID=62101 RepID=A0A1D2QMY1_9GAMM|nr:hypothetical protein AB835_11590 [Candidatus Endobugula sertula]
MVNNHPPFNIEPVTDGKHLVAIAIEGDSNTVSISDDYIRVYSVEGQESVSQPFQLTVELRADDTEKSGLLLDSRYLGHWAKIRVAMLEGTALSPRYFRGIITELAVGAPGIYTLTLQSPLHLLTLRNDYHIFSNCDIRQLVTQLLAPELMSPCFALRFDFGPSPTLTRVQDWMQAGESSMDMLHRVMSKAFINYFFIHEENLLTLVFSDKAMTADTVSIPGYDKGPLPLRYTFTSVQPLKSEQYDVFADLRSSIKMMPTKVNTLLTQIDPEWKDNTVATFHNFSVQSDSSSPVGYRHHRNYNYGVSSHEAHDQQTKIQQQIATEEATLTGTVYIPLLSPGYCFQLSNPLLKVKKVAGKGRPEFDGKVYVVTKIQHKISSETGYTGSIESTEVVTGGEESQKTYLTPFSMQGTQQGSVVAKVLDHVKPEGWRYRHKNNFQPEKGQVLFENKVLFSGECSGEMGCLVELATGQQHWVALSPSSQSVPEVNAMVMIGRGSGESEQPELQQILASHGAKVIQPPDRRSASWQANTNWGSSYSTSYGDSISIHFGHNAQTDLDQAIRLVENAYDNVGMVGTDYGSSSYNKGGSWNVSLSGNQSNPDVGVIGASISQGSSFSESHAAHSYNYGSTNLSEGYSETGKSASVSIIGKYTSAPDLASPSFVSGKLPKDMSEYSGKLSNGDSFSRSSVLGRSISCNGIGITAPDVNISSIAPSTHYNSVFTLGISDNHSKTIGATLNDSLMVGLSFSHSLTLAAQISHSITIGVTASFDMRIGGTANVSTTIGPHSSISTQIADSFSLGTNIGNNISIQTNLTNNTSLQTTIGSSSDISTYIGGKNSVNTFIGAQNDVSLNVAPRNSSSVAVGATNEASVSVAARNSTNVSVGATNDTSINVAARNSTTIAVGASNDTSINVAASNSQSIAVASKTDTGINIGASTSMNVHLSDSMLLETSISSSTNIKTSISSVLEMINSLSTEIHLVTQGGP